MANFQFGEFSPKALESIYDSDARLNLWHGAVRSSKTINSIIRWIEFIKEAPEGGALLMVGKTERTLERNILGPLRQMVGFKRYKYKRGLGEISLLGRQVYVAGANNELAKNKIQGLTLAGAYCDELTLWPESFFRMLLSRLSVRDAKLFGTMNPEGPYHYIKKDFIDKAGELDLKDWHFRLEDNLNLDPRYIQSLKREYTGFWYKRYIDGLWVLAEGVIYDMFDPDVHVVSELPAMKRYWVGIDYGTTNPTVFLLVGLGVDNRLYVIDEWRWDSRLRGRQKTDSEYSKHLRGWLTELDVVVNHIFYDPSAASFGVQLWRDKVLGLTKADNSVEDGIRRISSLLSTERLYVHKRCEGLIQEMQAYTWDKKAAEKGEDKPIKDNDHGPDALRYVINGTKTVWSRWMKGVA